MLHNCKILISFYDFVFTSYVCRFCTSLNKHKSPQKLFFAQQIATSTIPYKFRSIQRGIHGCVEFYEFAMARYYWLSKVLYADVKY